MTEKAPTEISDRNLKKVITICYEMLELSDHGDKFRHDDRCGVVYGTLRDAAYKIRQIAEQELTRHRERNKNTT
ncbi:MAG: hypothetical protein HN737_09970 [Desulfobacterales bacterium]|jgi:hypothetical protein|nr:hypothetical protein [Desulfobacteraceae bacterium]MBT4364174.1 hypothetical protein [Desulfobacteraceae bacterium]MBT7086716.1 hypothetical protein [Desulfobacterales bacterium]MBT7697720.1 hypothetical protein [Desulfobacterales bacterium]